MSPINRDGDFVNIPLYLTTYFYCYNFGIEKTRIKIEMGIDLTGNQIIKLLRVEKPYLTKEFGVVNIGLFGSFAKGQSNKDSDIDMIVELKHPRFDFLAGLQIYLEKKFGRKIEIVRKGNKINSRFTKRVEKDVIYA